MRSMLPSSSKLQKVNSSVQLAQRLPNRGNLVVRAATAVPSKVDFSGSMKELISLHCSKIRRVDQYRADLSGVAIFI